MIKVYGQTSFSLFRSLNYTKPVVQEYMYSKRQGPQLPFKRIINEAKDLLFADQFVSNLAWLLSQRSVSTLHIPSWTGYHIKLWSRVPEKRISLVTLIAWMHLQQKYHQCMYQFLNVLHLYYFPCMRKSPISNFDLI